MDLSHSASLDWSSTVVGVVELKICCGGSEVAIVAKVADIARNCNKYITVDGCENQTNKETFDLDEAGFYSGTYGARHPTLCRIPIHSHVSETNIP